MGAKKSMTFRISPDVRELLEKHSGGRDKTRLLEDAVRFYFTQEIEMIIKLRGTNINKVIKF